LSTTSQDIDIDRSKWNRTQIP